MGTKAYFKNTNVVRFSPKKHDHLQRRTTKYMLRSQVLIANKPWSSPVASHPPPWRGIFNNRIARNRSTPRSLFAAVGPIDRSPIDLHVFLWHLKPRDRKGEVEPVSRQTETYWINSKCDNPNKIDCNGPQWNKAVEITEKVH